MNLFIALPLFVVTSVAAFRNSLRGRLFLGGLLAYFFYVYLSSAMMYAFNNFFLFYVAIFALCIVAFAMKPLDRVTADPDDLRPAGRQTGRDSDRGQ